MPVIEPLSRRPLRRAAPAAALIAAYVACSSRPGGSTAGESERATEADASVDGAAEPDGVAAHPELGAEAGAPLAFPKVQTQLMGAAIPRFVTPLTTLSGRRVDATRPVAVTMVESQQPVLPPQVYPRTGPFAAGTYVWGYDVGGMGASWPGATLEARRGTASTIAFTNGLEQADGSPPALQQYLPMDLTLHWADPTGASARGACIRGAENGGDRFTPGFHDRESDASELATDDAGVIGGTQDDVPAACTRPYRGPVPTVPHLHGAEVPSAFDGHPDAWFTPGLAQRGPAFVSSTYTYPNTQEATTLWMHDHALGMTRLNVYAGLELFYLLRDQRDTGRPDNPITLPAGPYEQELLVADRIFDTNGQLVFPAGLPKDHPIGFEGAPANPNLHPLALPEFFGDVMTVNGKSWPFLRVEPRRYRFRIVNGCNARFLQLALSEEAKAGGEYTGIATLFTDDARPPRGLAGPHLWQIGSDGGLLNDPVDVDATSDGVPVTGDPNSPHLLMAPGERADVIVDFSGFAGKRLVMTNLAVAPYPGGGVIVDALPPPALQGPQLGAPHTEGPYEVTTQVMELRVDLPLTGKDTSFDPTGAHPALRASPVVDLDPSTSGRPVDVRRQLVLDEIEDVRSGSPVEVLLENSHWSGLREGSTTAIPGSTSNGEGLLATEVPREGATELWEVANLTPDAHPLHVHLVQMQVLGSEPFNTESDLCPHGGNGQFGPDGDVRFDFSGPQYRAAWDALFPGGTFNGFHFYPGTFIPGFGPPLDYATPNADGAVGGNLAFSAHGGRYFVGAGSAPPVSVPPNPRDRGWKDTLRLFPCAVTRFVVRWAPQDVHAGSTHPGKNDFPFDPTSGGPGYVWHCHVLDHEDNEMMRPMLVSQ